MVQLARKTTAGAAEIVRGGAHALPFPDGAFTAASSIVAFFFFHPVAALRELRRVLDPDRGRIAVYTTPPELKGTEAAPYPLATRGHFYDDGELEALARAAGFGSVRVTRPDYAQLLSARISRRDS